MYAYLFYFVHYAIIYIIIALYGDDDKIMLKVNI
jgi:hypothetical protein